MALAAVKDPNDLVDYELSWATQLGTDTITSATWIVPAGIVKDSESNTTTTATVWLSGGTAGQQYQITCRVTTAGDRQLDRSIRIYVTER
jgi:hypothetical protein